MTWQPIGTHPRDGRSFYVWLPGWDGRGPLVRTAWKGTPTNGYFGNSLLNGGAAPGFNPKWWCEITAPPGEEVPW